MLSVPPRALPALILILLLAICVPTAAEEYGYGYLAEWNSTGTGDGQFYGPLGIATYRDSVYITDSGNNRVQKWDVNGTFLKAWGWRGTTAGEFYWPTGIAVDASGNVYVADTANDRVQKFDGNGTFLTAWGSEGVGDNQFISPTWITTKGSGEVYVVDSGNRRVQVFQADGTFVKTMYFSGSGMLHLPQGIAFTNAGDTMLVADEPFIKVYSQYGTFLYGWGGYTGDGTELSKPIGIECRDRGIYVSDAVYNRIKVFSVDGTLLTQWGGQGSGPGQFDQVHGIAQSDRDYIFVADTGNSRVQIFCPHPHADFWMNRTVGVAPLEVYFEEQSDNSIDTWLWAFGDGATSYDPKAVHTFTAPGTYTVNLTVTNRLGSNSTTHTVTVGAPAIDLEVNVSADGGTSWLDADVAPGPSVPAGGDVQWQYTVTNTGNTRLSAVSVAGVLGSIVTLPKTSLAAGERTTATVNSTAVAGQFVGSASVSGRFVDGPDVLAVVDDRDDAHYCGFEAPTASFSANPSSGIAPLTVQFADTSTGSPTAWTWDFGDGTNSTGQTPVHIFSVAGNYTVALTVANAAGSNNTARTVTVEPSPPSLLPVPPSAFLATDTDGDELYDDVNGNSRKDFADVVLYFNQMTWIAANEPVSAFDYNDNGRIDFADVVWLFNHL